MTATGVINVGIGNIDSVVRALANCNGNPFVIEGEEQIARATHLVLPGVGAFASGARRLRASGLVPRLTEAVCDKKTPFLGICLGMQLLCSRSSERGVESDGLGWIIGSVVALPCRPGERSPHVGWNDVEPRQVGSGMGLLEQSQDFYFTHGYCAQPVDKESVWATTPYAGGFASIIGCENIVGVQFHPEKSQRAGTQLLRRFLSC